MIPLHLVVGGIITTVAFAVAPKGYANFSKEKHDETLKNLEEIRLNPEKAKLPQKLIYY